MRFHTSCVEGAASVLLAALLTAAPLALACAESITLQCGPAGQQGSLTLDVDYDQQTVFIANGNPPRTVSALIEARYITFDSPYVRFRTRIDRMSGGVSNFVDGNWYAGGTCEKIATGTKPRF